MEFCCQRNVADVCMASTETRSVRALRYGLHSLVQTSSQKRWVFAHRPWWCFLILTWTPVRKSSKNQMMFAVLMWIQSWTQWKPTKTAKTPRILRFFFPPRRFGDPASTTHGPAEVSQAGGPSLAGEATAGYGRRQHPQTDCIVWRFLAS